MDNVDGKQARRTGTSSGLGELFDHGIDSLNCTLASLCETAAMGTGHVEIRHLHRFDSLPAHVLFNLGDIPHPYAVSWYLQWTYGGTDHRLLDNDSFRILWAGNLDAENHGFGWSPLLPWIPRAVWLLFGEGSVGAYPRNLVVWCTRPLLCHQRRQGTKER